MVELEFMLSICDGAWAGTGSRDDNSAFSFLDGARVCPRFGPSGCGDSWNLSLQSLGTNKDIGRLWAWSQWSLPQCVIKKLARRSFWWPLVQTFVASLMSSKPVFDVDRIDV